jgi:prepilin-type processing-associated H-X9-DG protein
MGINDFDQAILFLSALAGCLGTFFLLLHFPWLPLWLTSVLALIVGYVYGECQASLVCKLPGIRRWGPVTTAGCCKVFGPYLSVAISALILYPVFAQAREVARTKTCMTHLKRVGAAMRMYAEDYDGLLPQATYWCDAVLTYVAPAKDRPARLVFQCPSLKDQPNGQAYNAQMGGILTSRIASPSTTAMVFDGQGGWNQAGGAELVARRHNNGLNVLFADGQARWLKSLGRVVWQPVSIRHRTGR